MTPRTDGAESGGDDAATFLVGTRLRTAGGSLDRSVDRLDAGPPTSARRFDTERGAGWHVMPFGEPSGIAETDLASAVDNIGEDEAAVTDQQRPMPRLGLTAPARYSARRRLTFSTHGATSNTPAKISTQTLNGHAAATFVPSRVVLSVAERMSPMTACLSVDCAKFANLR